MQVSWCLSRHQETCIFSSKYFLVKADLFLFWPSIYQGKRQRDGRISLGPVWFHVPVPTTPKWNTDLMNSVLIVNFLIFCETWSKEGNEMKHKRKAPLLSANDFSDVITMSCVPSPNGSSILMFFRLLHAIIVDFSAMSWGSNSSWWNSVWPPLNRTRRKRQPLHVSEAAV